jgi:hypothetical protein
VALLNGRGTRCGWRGGTSEVFAGRKVGQTQLPGMAHSSALRKKQSLQVVSVRFAIRTTGTIGLDAGAGEGPVHQIDAISVKIFKFVVAYGNEEFARVDNASRKVETATTWRLPP